MTKQNTFRRDELVLFHGLDDVIQYGTVVHWNGRTKEYTIGGNSPVAANRVFEFSKEGYRQASLWHIREQDIVVKNLEQALSAAKARVAALRGILRRL